MSTEERDTKGRFAAGNHSGGWRQRIENLERERAELRGTIEVEREATRLQTVKAVYQFARANALEARARWAEEVALPTLLASLPVIVDALWVEEVKEALDAYPQSEKETPA